MLRTHILKAVAIGALVGFVATVPALAMVTCGPMAVSTISPPPTPKADPSVLSIRFLDESAAMDYYLEAKSLGESVCLDDIYDGNPQIWWLHSC